MDGWDKEHPAPRATVTDSADHIDHIKKVAGIDHIGLGGDFSGITRVPLGLGDVSKYPALTAELFAVVTRTRSEEDPRPQHPARDAPGRENVQGS